MGHSADASIKIYAELHDWYDFKMKKFCKALMNDDYFYREIGGLSFTKKWFGTRPNEKMVGVVEFSADDRGFWVSQYGIIMLKNLFLGRPSVNLDEAIDEAIVKADYELLEDFTNETGCMIDITESSFEFGASRRTVVANGEVLLYEEDKLDEDGNWTNKDFGKRDASEFFEQWLIKLELSGR